MRAQEGAQVSVFSEYLNKEICLFVQCPYVCSGVKDKPLRGAFGILDHFRALRERLADKDAVIDDLRERLDREGEERRRLTAILTNQRERPIITPPPEPATVAPVAPPAPAKEQGWWRRMMGGR